MPRPKLPTMRGMMDEEPTLLNVVKLYAVVAFWMGVAALAVIGASDVLHQFVRATCGAG